MAEALVLYSNPMSRGRTARWMLEETGQPYRVEHLDYGTTLKAPEYLAINPMGKIPALLHGETIVTECAAICAYLADAFPAAGLAPKAGDPARGAYFRWLFFGAGPIEAAITNKILGVQIPPGRERAVGYGSFETAIDVLEQAVSATPYLAGAAFSAADIYTGSQIGMGLRFGTIEPRAAFTEYWTRISTRPAAIRAAALDDALLAPKE